MSDKYKLLQENPQYCTRLFGIKFELFEDILRKVQEKENEYLLENPLSNRGLAGEFTLPNQLLLTFEYLRQYSTFLIGPPMRLRILLWNFRKLCQ